MSTDLRRLATSTGVYAAAAVAQQAVGFLLIPFYTRLIPPNEYGVLEIFNAFSGIGFACLTMGLSSAINKVYHRDCGDSDKRTVLVTAVLLDLPVLLGAALLLLACARPLSVQLTGSDASQSLVTLAVASGFLYSIATLLLAGLRAQERATAFALLSLVQFLSALALNLFFVVKLGWGVRGVFWGNLLSNALLAVLAAVASQRTALLHFSRPLVRPLLSFGLYLIPVMLAGWVMDMSDRYFLRLYGSLDEVAVYGVGYKFGMILQVAIVWPFQLAWPAFSFGISKRPGHQQTYARTLTYLMAVQVLAVLGLALLAPVVLPRLLGKAYHDAYRIIPFVALAYACNGIQYCVAPGIHLANRTKQLSVLAMIAAALNIALNLLLIPPFGMFGAAWSTLLAFLFLALTTAFVAQSGYPVPYEYGRLAKLLGAAVLTYIAAQSLNPDSLALAIAWRLALALLIFPLLLLAGGFLVQDERALFGTLVRRWRPSMVQK
ncbi:MAG: lipopolysaccharide biosynthesis protein [Deltaproteobacteria bacterium]|nr:lipopolysaccharide biosynthesis protein [Deltaproteobacteria bacterium]